MCVYVCGCVCVCVFVCACVCACVCVFVFQSCWLCYHSQQRYLTFIEVVPSHNWLDASSSPAVPPLHHCMHPKAWRCPAMNNRCILITCCWSLVSSHSFFCRQPEAWRYRAINGWIQGIVNISGATRTSTLSRSLNLQRQRSGIGESCYDSWFVEDAIRMAVIPSKGRYQLFNQLRWPCFFTWWLFFFVWNSTFHE